MYFTTLYFSENIKIKNSASLIFGTMKEGLFPDILRGIPKYFVGGSRATFFFDDFFSILWDICSKKSQKIGAFMLISFKLLMNMPWGFEPTIFDQYLTSNKKNRTKFTKFLAFFEITPKFKLETPIRPKVNLFFVQFVMK